MDKRLKSKWVKALRSGKYKQGFGALKSDNSYCCLGVLCDVSNIGAWDKSNRYLYNTQYSAATITQELRNKVGLTVEQQGKLIDLNDSDFKSFEDIASYIERYM